MNNEEQKPTWYGTEYDPKITAPYLISLGLKVRVKHYRYLKGENKLYPQSLIRGLKHYFQVTTDNFEFHPRGGRTEIVLQSPDNKFFKGEANCSPKDPWKRSVGIALAGERALKNWGKNLVSDTRIS